MNELSGNRRPRSKRASNVNIAARYGSSRMVLFLASLAAVSAPWSGVKFGEANIADFFILLSVLAVIWHCITARRSLRVAWWYFLPAAVAGVLVIQGVVLWGLPLQQTGAGVVSPLLMASRIAITTAGVAVVVASVRDLRGGDGLRALLRWWLAGITASAAFSLLQANGLAPELPGIEQTVSLLNERFPGLASHPNALAQSCVFALPALAYLAVSKASGPRWLGAMTAVPVILGAIFATGSRAGLLFGFIALVLTGVAVIVVRRRTPILIILLPVSAPLLVLWFETFTAGTRLSGSDLGVSASDYGRMSAIARGWQLFLENPVSGAQLGVWYGEMSWIVILSGGGLLLALAYAVFLVAPLRQLVRSSSRSVLVLGTLTLLLICAFATLNNGIFERYTFWSFLILAAMQSPPEVSALPSRPLRSARGRVRLG